MEDDSTSFGHQSLQNQQHPVSQSPKCPILFFDGPCHNLPLRLVTVMVY
jgi:hypothetical protein